MRYIHSGDQVETGRKKASAPEHADLQGDGADGGEQMHTEQPEHKGEADGSTDIGVDAGATGYGDHDLQASVGAGTPDQEGEKTEGEEEPEVSGISDSAEDAGSAEQRSSGQDDQKDSRQEGNERQEADEGTGGGLKGFWSTLFGDESDPEESSATDGSGTQGAETSGIQDSGATGNQDAEISGELGTEPESGKKGFFARLFGEEPDEEAEEPGADQGKQENNRPQDRESSEKPRKQAAEPQEKIDDPIQEKRDFERSDSLEQSIIYWQGNDDIPEHLEDTKKTLTEVLGLGSSFDIVFREMTFGGRKAALLCISGFAKDTIIDEILKRLTYLTPDEVSTGALSSFMTEYIPHVQVEKGELLSESINKVLSGMSVFFIEGEKQVIIMDTRAYPARGPDEPSIERVVRGARDGFTETLLSNVALVRRRLRDPGLKYEMHQVGRRTRTDVCVAYIDDIVDKTQVQAVTDKIKSIDIDGIPLADKQLEEAIVGRGWNPYPLVRYSERPDTVASHLLEGRVVIFVDTSPSVIVLPTTFFDLCQHAEENRQTPFMGTYLRWVRFIGVFASMFLLPLWMLLVIHPELKPPMLEFIGPQKMAKIPILGQFLIVELGVDLLRMAAVHTPTPLGSAMGLIAAILVGDIAVQTGLFVNEVVLYMAVASIGMFATPSYELGLANRIVRLVLLLAVAAFQVQGFMIGSTLLIILLTTHRSYNSSYLWPFIPFNAKAMGAILVRQPVLSSKARPSFNKTRDNTRMPPVQENDK
ncbi:stage V sporulation protein AF [Paenibacillus sp. PastF-1]|nr:stage V sporulation protein AF [Paenibacillus sp. PastF-2]MDF9846973.1 stage V sporulation protein AF [Paenibacillus sp. PastM-2]MDF9853545.1 stage V sporulation protein AF [Paenibacillus sp. PastF-1]MDH6478969.1 stage V sporulation protein AF [Paenibacillus sp. PastH-2]MDH6506701.1 stage V sporulation protein AF [Paenibacillus sp. PastM-3]